MKSVFIIIALFCIVFTASAQRFSAFTGLTYIQQYPDGPNIRNNFFPNVEGNMSYAFVNAKYVKVSTGLGVATHNFGLHDISENKNYYYFRLEPFGLLTVQGNLPEENNFIVYGFYTGLN